MPVGGMIGAGVLGAGAQIFGAQTGAAAQRDAAANANALQQQQMAMTQGILADNKNTLSPWINQGANTNSTLATMLGTGQGGTGQGVLNTPFAPTMESLRKTPGYQFVLDQGLKSTQNSYAAKGLGSSGAAMKGAADYAEGLAGTTYQQQFDNYWKQNKSIYDMLTGQSQQGLSAAGAITGQGIQAAGLGQANANQQGANLIGAGNATAGANVATGNAIASGATGAANNYMQYNLLQHLLGANGTGSYAAFGGQSPQNGGVWGGSSLNPLAGLSASDYGQGY